MKHCRQQNKNLKKHLGETQKTKYTGNRYKIWGKSKRFKGLHLVSLCGLYSKIFYAGILYKYHENFPDIS